MLNLDTHILIYALIDKLRPKERELLQNDSWGISAIVLWEINKLHQLKRIELDIQSTRFRKAIAALHVWAIDWEIAEKSTNLDVHSDTADEIIAATSIVHRAPLLTRDKVLRRSKQIPLAR